MELLLNLAWLVLALLACIAFARRRKEVAGYSRVSYGTSVLALACALVLLFPVVSASDDLHPTQAVLEDATKRIQRLVAPEHHGDFSSFSTLPALLAIYLLSALVVLQVWHSNPSEARVISLSREPVSGRSPPSL
jgi:hypothetical protein